MTAIDPGAEFSKPREGKLGFIIGFVERHPACTLPGGEAALLVSEVRRLEKLLGGVDASGKDGSVSV